MRVLCNEWDGYAAAWIRELSSAGEIQRCDVSEKSVVDLTPDDLKGYDQCHFFAGIAGWPLALRMAGLEDVKSLWTGSPPCQPFSVAGKGEGKDDERHLAPTWIGLIREERPVWIFGEQVADAIRHGWLDDLFDALEGCGYACGAAVLPACSVGAPHIRKRLFFGATQPAHTIRNEQSRAQSCGWPTGRMGRVGEPVSWDASWQSSLARLRTLDDGVPRCVAGTDAARNAIVPHVAAGFMTSFMAAAQDMLL